MKKHWITYLALISLFVLAFMVPIAGAFDNYAGGCDACHGSFPSGPTPYVSQHDGVAWKNPSTNANLNLHDGHRYYMLGSATFGGSNTTACYVCHASSGRTPVVLNSSTGITGFSPIGCTGCHDGNGLRQHHVGSGAYNCYDCHTAGASPAENVKPPYYFTPDTVHPNKPTDPCNINGSEGRVGSPLGLDNDGNLLYDQNDPACAVAAAILSVSPTTLTYGNQSVGTTSATQTVTISNTGTAVLSVTGITNNNTTDYVLTAPALPFNVAAAASQTFTMAFSPGSSGAKSASVSITSNGGSATVSATGTGVAPVLGVSPTTLTFSSQTIGTTSAAQTITISNTGTGTLNVTGITSSNAEFAFSPSSLSSIAAGGSATLSITFAPAASGARSSNINILSNGGNATVAASGTGVAAGALSVSPTTLTYANQTVGTTSVTQTVTVSNTGGSAITVNSFSNSNTTDFVLAAPATPLTINGGASQTFTLAFRPGSSGAKTATITVASSVGNATVAASGTGVAATVSQPVMSVSPLSRTFSNVPVSTTASQTVTISNTGNAPLSITSIVKSGSAAFSFSPASFPAIAAGASATLTVTYTPTAVGTNTGTININSNGGNAAVSLTGNAVAQASNGSGDVALVKLTVPSSVSVRVGESFDMSAIAQATNTRGTVGATVTLNAAANSNVSVSIGDTSLTEDLKSGINNAQNFNFDAKISCSRAGTWPVTWTARISAARNSNTSNDTLTGTTQVTCSGGSSESQSSTRRQ
jgi:hypothetical protein